MRQMTNTVEIKKFIYGGKAYFSITSDTSGNSFNFLIKKLKDNDVFYVYAITEEGRLYIGHIIAEQFKCKLPPNASPTLWQPILFLLRGIQKGSLHPKMAFFHKGKCGVCGRPLTDPASIDRGIGPICAKGMGL